MTSLEQLHDAIQYLAGLREAAQLDNRGGACCSICPRLYVCSTKGSTKAASASKKRRKPKRPPCHKYEWDIRRRAHEWAPSAELDVLEAAAQYVAESLVSEAEDAVRSFSAGDS